jgi:hypothetical protein
VDESPGFFKMAPWALRVCLHDDTLLLALHGVSHAVIAVVYLLIVGGLWYFCFRRRDMPFRGLVLWFGVFLLSCAVSHLLAICDLFWPRYGITGTVQAVTGLCATWTLWQLWRLMPAAMAIPSVAELATWRAWLDQEKQKLRGELATGLTRVMANIQEILTRL